MLMRRAWLLLSSSTLVHGVAAAQGTQGGAAPAVTPPAAVSADKPAIDPTSANNPPASTVPAPQEAADVSLPGEIVVRGRRDQNLFRTSDQVVSVLSTAEIARTGDGNIAGALGRVTGLTVVGNGFVFVRGLGDRYSLALLNGLPLPSPEPLRRVVPLDLFPTNVVASSLVQKSYSANFPGEFGGGVINLTTTAVPKESFFTIGAGISADTETTGHAGYTYYGAKSDWTGFDNGSRDIPPALRSFLNSGVRIGDGIANQQSIAGELVRFSRVGVQKISALWPSSSASLSGGTAFDMGSARVGVLVTGGYSNRWTSRDAIAQTPSKADLSETELNARRISSDNRIVVNALVGLGVEWDEHKVRMNSFFVRDTIKQARLAEASEATSGFTRRNQDTAWFERQLLSNQLVGEFRFGDLSLDIRGGVSRTDREAPYELGFGYVRTNLAGDPLGSYFVNRLNNGQLGSASVAFSDLTERLYYGGIDLSYRINDAIGVAAGYAYTDTKRTSSRREFQFIAPSTLPNGVALLRADLLLSPGLIDFYKIGLVETTESDPAFKAALRINAGYVKANIEPIDGLTLDVGVRYERAEQSVEPVQVFKVASNSLASTRLKNGYWLPGLTATYEASPQLQLRASVSRTVARPQFRELIFQQYYDPEADRLFRGNPLLVDSKLFNAEARVEWYFAPQQRVAVAGFYKKIDRPIEAFTGFTDNSPQTSFANAPKATLWGVELDAQKTFALEGASGFFEDRRLVLAGNYTFTKSKIQATATDIVSVFGTTPQPATNFFRPGAPLTGQSDHIANLQIGVEKAGDLLSQQTLLLTYASDRVTSRGPVGLPDIKERPGLRLDFVVRQGARVANKIVEFKGEVRNILGTDYREFQTNGKNSILINAYDLGTIFSLSASMKF